MTEGRDWRILLVDDHAAQRAEAPRRLVWHRGYALAVHGDRSTGEGQVNDAELRRGGGSRTW